MALGNLGGFPPGCRPLGEITDPARLARRMLDASTFPGESSKRNSAPLREVAGGPVPGPDLAQERLLAGADLLGHIASGMEPAPGGRMGGARNVPLQDDPLPPPPRIGDRDRREQ